MQTTARKIEMGEKNQPNLTEVIIAYKWQAAICLILIAIKLGYVETGDIGFKGFKILIPDSSIVVYVLSGGLLFLSIKSFYFPPCSNGKHSELIYFAFLILSLFTLSVSIPPNYPTSIAENLVMMGYFFISLFLAHIVIELMFMSNQLTLTKEQADALQTDHFTYYARSIRRKAICLAIVVFALIMPLFFIFADEKINLHGLVAVFVSLPIGMGMQAYIERTSKDKKTFLKKFVYKFTINMNELEETREHERIFNNPNNDLLPNRKEQNEISKKISDKYEELMDISEYENTPDFVREMDVDKRQIILKLKSKESDFNVRRFFLAFRYSLPVHIIREKIDRDTLTPADLLPIFEHIVDKDIPTKKKLQNATSIARKHNNYAGIIVIRDSHVHSEPSAPVDKNLLAVGIYISLEYSLSLSRFSELCSQYLVDNDEFNPAKPNQFSAMFRHATQKHLDEIILREKDQVFGYDLAISAVNNGSYNKLKTAIEIDSVDVNTKEKGTEWTFLNMAMANGYYELAKYLLDKGADPNIPNYLGRFPIHFASHCYNLPLVELLLEFGAKIDVKNDSGNTPLMIAIARNNEKTVEFLLKKGADIEAVNNADISVIDFARKIDLKLVKLITQSKSHTAR